MISFFGVVGPITIPSPVGESWGGIIPEPGKGGLIGLVSNIIKLIMLVGGLWSFFNLIIAGITYITAGDNPDELKKANNRMTMSLIGLVLMIGSFTITAIISYIIFKDASFILNPTIFTPNEIPK